MPLSNDSVGRSRGSPPSALYALGVVQQRRDVTVVDPQPRQLLDRLVVGERLGQEDTVDAARGRARQDVDDDPALDGAVRSTAAPGFSPSRRRQVAVHALGAAELVVGQVQRGAVGRGRARGTSENSSWTIPFM